MVDAGILGEEDGGRSGKEGSGRQRELPGSLRPGLINARCLICLHGLVSQSEARLCAVISRGSGGLYT